MFLYSFFWKDSGFFNIYSCMDSKVLFKNKKTNSCSNLKSNSLQIFYY